MGSYLRLRNILIPSISVTYSNPASISLHASAMFCAVPCVHSSSVKFTKCV